MSGRDVLAVYVLALCGLVVWAWTAALAVALTPAALAVVLFVAEAAAPPGEAGGRTGRRARRA